MPLDVTVFQCILSNLSYILLCTVTLLQSLSFKNLNISKFNMQIIQTIKLFDSGS